MFFLCAGLIFTAQKLPEKRAARFALYRALAEVAMAEFTWLRNDMGLIANDAERAAQLDHGLKEFGHRIKLIDGVAKESTKTQDHVIAELRAWFDDDQKPTFLWQLHFGEIFAQGGFDIVIGNPPYGGLLTLENQELIQRKFSNPRRVGDLYPLFIQLAPTITKKRGIVCYINSNTWLLIFSLDFLRRRICEFATWKKVAVLPPDIFRAVVDTHIIIIQNQIPDDTAQLDVEVLNSKGAFHLLHQLQLKGLGEGGAPINVVATQATATLAKKLIRGATCVGREYSVYNGVKPFEKGKGSPPQTARTMLEKPFVKEGLRPSQEWRPLLRGSLIEKYRVRWNNDSWILYGPWLAAPRAAEIFEHHDMVCVRQTGDSIVACRAIGDFIARDNLHIALPISGQAPLHGLDALLNSAVCQFAYSFINPETGEALAQVKKAHLEALPVPAIWRSSAKDRGILGKLAEACAAAAQRGDEATLAVYESEIDQIVYRLFDLTPDEIALIESALAPTRTNTPKRKRAAS